MVGADGTARLLDFGVAKAVGSKQERSGGRIKGKVAYMAPEQLDGSGVSARTDLYAFAIVLWESVTGRRMFVADSDVDLLARVIARDIPSLRTLAPEVPETLAALIERALSPDPADRCASAREMLEVLETCGKPATPIAVGEWLSEVAGSALAQRAAKVASTSRSGSDLASGSRSLLHADPGRRIRRGRLHRHLAARSARAPAARRTASRPRYSPIAPSAPVETPRCPGGGDGWTGRAGPRALERACSSDRLGSSSEPPCVRNRIGRVSSRFRAPIPPSSASAASAVPPPSSRPEVTSRGDRPREPARRPPINSRRTTRDDVYSSRH